MANEFIIKNGFFSQGSSNITGSLTVSQGITGSLFGTASWSQNASTAVSSSFSQTASYLNTLNQNLTFNGNLTLNGTASIAYLNVTYETASVIYSSGSNQFGDSTSDTQTLIGRVVVSGSLDVTGSIVTTAGIGVNVSTPISGAFHALSTTGTDTVMYFDGGAGANARLTAAANTVDKLPGLFLFDRNVGDFLNNAISGSVYIALERSTSPQFASRNDALYVNNHPNKGHYFATNNGSLTSVRMLIDGAGNVGIGKYLPNAALDVYGNTNITGSLGVSSGITGSLFGTASWAENVTTASYIDPLFISASAAASGFGGATVSASYALTASYIDSLFISASAAAAGFGPVITAGGVNGQIQYNNNSAFSGVSVLTYDGFILRGTGSFSGSFSGYLEGTASYANLANSASYVESASYSLTSNLSNNTILFNGSDKNVFATTGSNSFTGEQTINGSLTITQNLTVLGSSSIQYITSSQLVISDNIISVNTFSPSLRFGGLAVIDSGSVSNTSGSLLFDSQNNQWIFVHQSEGSSAVTSSVLIMGPQTFDNVGNELTITSNRLTKGTGGDLGEHIGDSNITDTGTVVSINSNTEITGSVIITAGVTGSSFNISNAPTLNNTNTQILTRNSTTGQIEYSNQSSAYIFNYGLAHAISNFNYLI